MRNPIRLYFFVMPDKKYTELTLVVSEVMTETYNHTSIKGEDNQLMIDR